MEITEKMERPIPFEEQDPELAEVLVSICEHNSKVPKKDRIHVDFERGEVGYAVARAEVKPNRNDPCPCGSGKKYKKCCI